MDKRTLKMLVDDGYSTRQIAGYTGKGQTTVRYWLKKHGLKTIYNRRSWTDEEFIAACANNVAVAGVLRDIGLSTSAGNYDTFYRYANKLDVDYSHFTGQASGHGGSKKKPLEDVMVKESTYSRSSLKKRLLDKGLLENECYICGIGPEWNNEELTMVLDHINGINNDHRLGNLRMLCPNCNSQQDTFCR